LNLLFFGDLHIDKDSLEECKSVLDEILSLCKTHNITQVYDLGDTFDKITPSPFELDLFSSFLKELNLPITILAAQSHESISNSISIINHFGILKETVQVLKEYKDNNYLYCGHFIVNQSKKNMGGTVDSVSLKDFAFVLLGHGHNPEMIGKNIIQLGSCRFVDFGEDKSLKKHVGICLDYKGQSAEWKFVPLTSVIPMIDIELHKKEVKNSKLDPQNEVLKAKSSKIAPTNPPNAKVFKAVPDLCAYLDKLNPKTKVRIIFKDYHIYSEYLPCSISYSSKFYQYKEKKEFVISDLALGSVKNETITLKENLKIWIEKNKVPEDIKKVLLEEVK
jgi:DNA repair exonuclease SbcCD nuclease subunit